MKTNKFIYLIATIFTLGVTSCSEDECNHIIPPPPPVDNPLVGSWYAEDDNEETTLNESGTVYDRYCNLRRTAQTEGQWEYDKDNNKLTYRFSFLGQVQFIDWSVKELTEISAKLSSDKNGVVGMQRIVAAYKLAVGDSVTFAFPTEIHNYNGHTYKQTYTPKSYTSRNPRLASVDNNGLIVATGEKGTTYIKVETDKGIAWVRVTVGDDCMDLWYDWPSFMGADYNTVSNALGHYSAVGQDGYLFGWSLATFNDQASRIDMYFSPSTGKVIDMLLNLKDVQKAEVLAYLEAHYYPCAALGGGYYTTGPTLEESIAVVYYDAADKTVEFVDAAAFVWPSFEDALGMNAEQVKEMFGTPYSETSEFITFIVDGNVYTSSAGFYMQKKSGLIYQIAAMLRTSVSDGTILKILDSKFYANSQLSNIVQGVHAFTEHPTLEESKFIVYYDRTQKCVFYVDATIDTQQLWNDYTEDLGADQEGIDEQIRCAIL